MTIKISINDNEVANPILRLVISILIISVALIIISVILFLVLPLIWLAILWLVILLISLPLIVASLMRHQRDITLQKKLGHKNPNQ